MIGNPPHYEIGQWGLWLLMGDKLYIRHLPTYEGGVFSLPEFEREVWPWNDLHLMNTPCLLAASITKFYSERF